MFLCLKLTSVPAFLPKICRITGASLLTFPSKISASEDHWFTLVMTAAVPFEAEVIIDFTIAVPQGAVIQFFN